MVGLQLKQIRTKTVKTVSHLPQKQKWTVNLVQYHINSQSNKGNNLWNTSKFNRLQNGLCNYCGRSGLICAPFSSFSECAFCC